MEQMLNIGNKITKDAVYATARGLLMIIETKAGDNVKIAAINALAQSHGISHVTIDSCSFTGVPEKK